FPRREDPARIEGLLDSVAQLPKLRRALKNAVHEDRARAVLLISSLLTDVAHFKVERFGASRVIWVLFVVEDRHQGNDGARVSNDESRREIESVLRVERLEQIEDLHRVSPI